MESSLFLSDLLTGHEPWRSRQSAIRNPQSAIRNPQSAIRNQEVHLSPGAALFLLRRFDFYVQVAQLARRDAGG